MSTAALTTAKSSDSGLKIILKGLLKSTQDDEDLDLVKSREFAGGRDGEDRKETESQLGLMGLEGTEEYSVIMDDEPIRKIRAKRERMRQARATASDYISLDGGGGGIGCGGGGDEMSDEEPEFRSRIALIGSKNESGVFQNVGNDDDGIEGVVGRGRVVVDNGNGGTMTRMRRRRV